MPDVTEAAAQDAIADSLLGDPQTDETTEQTPVGTEDVVEPQEELAEGELETQTEDADDWLPGDQDKIFPDEVYARYAERYQLSPEQAKDPLLRQLLHDKINSDIQIRNQMEQQDLAELEVPEELAEPTREPQKLPSFDEYVTGLRNQVQQYTDPQMAQLFTREFLGSFLPPEEVAKNLTPELATKLTTTFSTFGLNLIRTALQNEFLPMMEQVMPGVSGMYFQSSRATSWDTVRNSNPAFGDLPAYGSKEFVQLCQKLDSEFPALTEMGLNLEKQGGGQLHGRAAEQFYLSLAKLAIRQNASPEIVARAAATGAKRARQADVRRQAGNLGAGKSSGTISQKPNDDIFEEGLEIYHREHGRL